MKYKILLKTLRILIYIKRFFWWFGSKGVFAFAVLFGPFWKLFGYIWYKLEYYLKKVAAGGRSSQFIKRDYLQAVVLAVLFVVALPQTKIYAGKDRGLPGQKTIAYSLTETVEDYATEEVSAEPSAAYDSNIPVWQEGSLSQERFAGSGISINDQDWSGVMAGGLALTKPFIFPGGLEGAARDEIMEYIVQPGDTLGGIAARLEISIATVLWENNLTARSFIRPGDRLRILPITGLTHKVKKGDVVSRIASKYSASASDIIKFNKLKENGSDLVIGETIIIPNGIKPRSAVAQVPTRSTVSRAYTPPSSRQLPSASGFVWPSSARVITQYFTWVHHGLDIAGGNFSTPIYAAKGGKIEKAQCGWNNGYGCVVIIDHGGGVKTLYGHSSRLLVSAGENVNAGQTISLMGNTGKVRGKTGIHLHFEIILNGRRVNPLGYVR